MWKGDIPTSAALLLAVTVGLWPFGDAWMSGPNTWACMQWEHVLMMKQHSSLKNDIPNSGWLVSSLHMQKLWLTILDTSQTFSSCMQCKQSWMQTHHWQKQTHRKSGHLLCVSSINECCVWVWHLRKEQAIEDSNSQTVCQICAQKGLRVTQRPKPQ